MGEGLGQLQTEGLGQAVREALDIFFRLYSGLKEDRKLKAGKCWKSLAVLQVRLVGEPRASWSPSWAVGAWSQGGRGQRGSM